jgi:hypothetical protein
MSIFDRNDGILTNRVIVHQISKIETITKQGSASLLPSTIPFLESSRIATNPNKQVDVSAFHSSRSDQHATDMIDVDSFVA